MTHTLIDVYNNMLKYNEQEIIIILDGFLKPWFKLADIMTILNYTVNDDLIKKIKSENQRKWEEIQHYATVEIKNIAPSNTFINEVALLSLLMNDKRTVAVKLRKWIVDDILPALYKIGKYEAVQRQNVADTIDNLRKKVVDLQTINNNLTIEHALLISEQKIPATIYILRDIGQAGSSTIGKSALAHNTTIPSNMEILFTLSVDDMRTVEDCITLFMKKYVYRKNNKEYYECSIKKLKETIIKCDKLSKDEYYCDNCHTTVNSLSHFVRDHNVKINDELCLDIRPNSIKNQAGGAHTEGVEQCHTTNYLSLVEFPLPKGDGEHKLNILAKIPINDVLATRLRITKLDFYADKDNVLYPHCKLSDIPVILSECGENTDQICDVIANIITDNSSASSNLNIDQVVGLYINTVHPKSNCRLTCEEFNARTVVDNDGRILLPNGVIILPSGKCICPP